MTPASPKKKTPIPGTSKGRAAPRRSYALLAAGTGIAVAAFHGTFLSGCGSTNPCFSQGEGGAPSNACHDYEPDAGDASTDAPGDAPSE